MNILIFDIGNTHTKYFRFIVDSQDAVFINSATTPTPRTTSGILAVLREYLEMELEQNPIIDVIVPTSFSNAVALESEEGEWFNTFSDSHIEPEGRFHFPYELTGYSTNFADVPSHIQALQNLKLQHSWQRALPISSAIAAILCDNKNWRYWDITHASNSGMWDQARQDWIPSVWPDHINAKIVYPCEIVGKTKLGSIPIMVGGHDTLFVPSMLKSGYISVGTYTTVSVPRQKFLPNRFASATERWIRDALGNLHRQLCFKTPKSMTREYFDKIATYIAEVENISIFGREHIRMLNEIQSHGIGHTHCSPFQQYIETARYAEKHIRGYYADR